MPAAMDGGLWVVTLGVGFVFVTPLPPTFPSAKGYYGIANGTPSLRQ